MLRTTINLSILILMNSCVVWDNGEWEPLSKPKLVKQEEPKVGVILIGDTGTGEKDQYAVADAMKKYCDANKCDMGLMLGDNIYSWGVKSKDDPQFQTKFEKPYKDLKFRFFPVIGNHDDRGSWKAQVEYESPHWKMFGRWYSMENPFLSIYALDTNWGAFSSPFSKDQRKWLKDKLSKDRSRWVIVYGHHPIYSSGNHGDSFFLKHYLLPILQENHVDFYASGHDHDQELIERDGLAFVVAGSGAKLTNVKAGKHSVFAKSSFGFAHLLLSESRAILRFIDQTGKINFEKSYNK